MNTRNFRLVCFLVLATLANAAHADHPNIARGFDVGKPYQMNGIDNINLFNGNLTVTLPIGQRYHVNGGLSYGLALVYSGNVWDTVNLEPLNCSGTTKRVTRTYPSRRSNAGIGWLLSLGRLFPRNAYPIQDSLYWQYETPDGAVHSFHVGLHDGTTPNAADPTISYTRDGTYLRMSVEANDRKVEFPDGTWQVFKELDTSNWQPATESSQSPEWRLTEIHDRSGNVVTIAYSSTANNPEIWTIYDGTRTQTVYFADASSAAQYASPYDLVLDKVVLSVLNGNTAEWKPAYAWQTIWAGGSNQGCDLLQHPWSNVPLLTSLTLPAVNNVSQVYSMVAPNGSPDYYINSTEDLLNAHLTGLQLPTGGWLEWGYQNFGYYETGSHSRTVAVNTRRMVGKDRVTRATWNYGRQLSGLGACVPEQLVVSVTSPEQVTSVHYFSTYKVPESDQCQPPPPTSFDPAEYAMPFTRGVSQTGANGTTRYLSEEVYSSPPTSLCTADSTCPGYRVVGGTLVRSEWVTYSYDATAEQPDLERNSRESAHATLFEDDPNCGGQTCYSSVTRYGFDGAGHFRQSSTGGNFPVDGASHGNNKTSFTKYPDVDVTGAWLLNTYTERCVKDETSEHTEVIAQCSDLSAGTLISQSCFDSTTGFLKRTRGLSGTAPSAHDVLAVYTPLSGNVSQEDYYGGDTQTLPDQASDLCSVTLPSSPQYTIANTYLNGSLETSRYRPTNSHSADPVVYSVKNTSIDANTGLVKTSEDVAGLATTYDYDALGRLTQVAAPGEAAVGYAYTEATSSAPAKVTVTKTSTAAGTVQATTIFDDFGRVSKEQRVLPAGTATRETDYTGSGWTQQVSEWEATPSHFTVFSNFDSFGRAGKIKNPGQTDTTTTTIDYFGTRQVARTVNVGESLSGGTVQQQAATTTETYDAFGRLIKVDEPDSVSSTSYLHDAAGRLTSVTMTDTATSTTQPSRTFAYDGRGFLLTETHPENGTTTYGGYDARGHVGQKIAGASGSSTEFDLQYYYDAAERLMGVDQLHPPSGSAARLLKQFTFATANGTTSGNDVDYRQGKLTTAIRRNYSPAGTIDVTETYEYGDSAGRLTAKTTEVTGLHKFTQSYTYNDLGLPATISYPTCPDAADHPCATSSSMIGSIAPTYDKGLLKTVPNFATAISYDLNGMVTSIAHPGGVSDTMSVDATTAMARPKEIKFESYDPCSGVQIAQPPASTTITAGSSVTLTVTAATASTAPVTYQWFVGDSGDTSSPAGINSPSFTTPALQATTHYWVRLINSCGKADSTTAVVTVPVCNAPTVGVNPQTANYSTSAITLTATPSGCAPFVYQWYIGDTGNTSQPTGTNSPTFTTPTPLQVTTHYWVKVTNTEGSANSSTAIVTVAPPTPGALTATFSAATNTVTVAWGSSVGAARYDLQRLDHGSWTTTDVGNTLSASYSFSGVATYVFHVRAVDSSNTRASSYTANDLATTMAFATVQAGTVIAFTHFEEVRSAINALRTAYNNAAPASWRTLLNNAGYPTSVPEPAPGLVVQAAYLNALRTGMTAALSDVQVSNPSYTDTVGSGTPIKAVYINELQQRAR